MRKILVLFSFLVLACGLVACDWFKSSPSEPNSPDLPSEPVRVICQEVDSLLPAWGQAVNLDTGAGGFTNFKTGIDGKTMRYVVSFPKGFFEQSQGSWFVEINVTSPFPCGNAGSDTPRCYESRHGLFPVAWRDDDNQGKYLAAVVDLRRIIQ